MVETGRGLAVSANTAGYMVKNRWTVVPQCLKRYRSIAYCSYCTACPVRMFCLFDGHNDSITYDDSMIRYVMSWVNPHGCEVFSFKDPFNRKARSEFFPEELPLSAGGGTNRNIQPFPIRLPAYQESNWVKTNLKMSWSVPEKYGRIGMENHLFRNGTNRVKFFLSVPKEEHRIR